LLHIYNNIAKIIALQLLQREQASLLFKMVHVVSTRSPPHVNPTSTFYGILFSTLGFSYKAWIFKSIHHTTIFLSLVFLFSSFSLFSYIMGYLLFKEYLSL